MKSSKWLVRGLVASLISGIALLSAHAATPPKATPPTPPQPQTATVVQSYSIDAASAVKSLTLSVNAAPGNIEITVMDLLPKDKATYTVTVDVQTLQVVPAVLPQPTGQVAVSSPPTCEELIVLYNNELNADDSEVLIAKTGAELHSLTGSSNSPCKTSQESQDAATALAAFQQATTSKVDTSIAAGQRLIVTLMRNANATFPEEVIGRYTISTAPQPSQWLVFYGANFIRSADQQYYSATNAGTSPVSYTITPQANRSNWQFAPSVNFMWLPAQNFQCNRDHIFGGCLGRFAAWRGETSDVFGGLSAGLGFGTTNSTANPVAFLGYGVGWGYNVVAVAGVAMHQEKRLVGQYNSGQVVSTNLTPDQLAQSVYRASFFAGLQFRFGSNPFSSAATPKPAASPSTGAASP